MFGDGPRRSLDPGQRRAWLARLDGERRAGNLTALHVEVGKALLRRLGEDGQCDPSQASLAADSGAGERTVRRALDAMRALKLLRWDRRLVRCEWPAGGPGASRAEQTSNAYELLLPTGPLAPRPRRPVQLRLHCDGQAGRENPCTKIQRGLPELSEAEMQHIDALKAARTERLNAEWVARRTERWRSWGWLPPVDPPPR